MAQTAIELLASIISRTGGGGIVIPVPPTGISSSAGTAFNLSNAAPHNALISVLTLSGGLPQGTGTWSLVGTPWPKARLTASVGTSVELRIDDADGLDVGDNGPKTVALQYDGEGLVSPLTIALTITVVAVATPTGAYAFNHGLPWPLPDDDDDIVVYNVNADASGRFSLPPGSDTTWNKVLLVVPPAGGLTKEWTKSEGLKWGGILLIGFDFRRIGQTQLAGPVGNAASRKGGHLFEISFAAGSKGKIAAGRRPYLWFSNCRFDIVNPADSVWGDFLRHGTVIQGNATNMDDYHDFYFQNMYFDKGHVNFDSSTPGQETNPHSDLFQSAKGGVNNIYCTRCWIVWNGLMCYTLDSGNILNRPFKTRSPDGSRFFWEDISIQPADDPLNVDNGAWNAHTQSRSDEVWQVAENPFWRAFYPKNVKLWLPSGHPKANSPQDAWRTYCYQSPNTPGYPAPTPANPKPWLQPRKKIEGDRTYVYWVGWGGTGRTNGDKTVMGDKQVEFVATEAELDQVINPAHTGKAWRIATKERLREVFGGVDVPVEGPLSFVNFTNQWVPLLTPGSGSSITETGGVLRITAGTPANPAVRDATKDAWLWSKSATAKMGDGSIEFDIRSINSYDSADASNPSGLVTTHYQGNGTAGHPANPALWTADATVTGWAGKGTGLRYTIHPTGSDNTSEGEIRTRLHVNDDTNGPNVIGSGDYSGGSPRRFFLVTNRWYRFRGTISGDTMTCRLWDLSSGSPVEITPSISGTNANVSDVVGGYVGICAMQGKAFELRNMT